MLPASYFWCFLHQRWPRGQEVKTRPFHGCNTSSILVGVARKKARFGVLFSMIFAFFSDIIQFQQEGGPM